MCNNVCTVTRSLSDEESEPLATTPCRVVGRHTSQAQSRNQYLGGFETLPRIWGVSIVELF